MVIITKHTNKNTGKSTYKVHYFRYGALTDCTEKLSENVFNEYQKSILKGSKHIFIVNVATIQALTLTDFNLMTGI